MEHLTRADTAAARTDVVGDRPSIRAVHHVSFRVDDLEESLDFYIDVLGFTRRPRPEMGFPGAWLDAGGVEVHLLEVAADETTGASPSQTNPKANHVAFSVDDLQAFRAYLEGRGVEVTGPPISTIPQIFVRDPSGSVLEFNSFGR